MLGTPSCSIILWSMVLSISSIGIIFLWVDVRRGWVRVVAGIPAAVAEDPPALNSCEVDGHVNPILCPDVVRVWVAALHRLGGVEYRCRHNSTSTITSMAFRKNKLDCLPN